MTRPELGARALLVVLVLAACGPRERQAPRGNGAGDGDTEEATTCVSCELIDCEDESAPPDVASEDDCEDAASEQGCAEYTFDAGC